jgi:hypothetical protein
MKSLFAVCVGILSIQGAFAGSAEALSLRNPNTAPALLTCAREKGAIQKTERNECFSLLEGYNGVDLRERHDGKRCPGDKATAPARGFFSVQMIGNEPIVGFDDVVNGWQSCGFSTYELVQEPN